jgi:hypothetical protein
MAAVRAALCSLEIVVLDGLSGLPIEPAPADEHGWVDEPNVRVTVSREIDVPSDPVATTEWLDPPRLLLQDLPAGVYEIAAAARGYATALLPVALAPGQELLREVRLERPSKFRLLVDDFPEEALMLPGVTFQLTTNTGRPLCSTSRAGVAGGQRFLQFGEGPIGDVVLLQVGGVAARLNLVSGPNPDVRVSWRDRRQVSCGVQLYRPPLGQRADCCHAHVTLHDPRGTTVYDRVHGATIQGDGWAEVYDIRVVPGDYRLVLDFGAIRRVETDVTIPEDADVELRLPLD